ncbi:UdgX family uracil-DNA binding protein [Phenylobacterium sp.]|uniref:UdgX family uracil-DNA binding protein n=1 Tax=Phenylobacterium sp. TaxID=1871053 RepID=UPI00272EFDB6|nr:UdgX family uracil-DNA binding protein [Phenylobacterium sp.]MDP1616947.1 UdgX family uracil-DNA binding protein [Phenylobacterium sp.]MDP1986391.1 UdgX family uracil-DNA binding protein [Phenylobacterium sp.]
MRVVRLASETDFEGWRVAARTLRAEAVEPAQALWTVDGGQASLFPADAPQSPEAGTGGFKVSRAFVDLAGRVALHRSPERFDLLYRLLWRLEATPRLLEIASDPDVSLALDMQSQVNRAVHKMKAFVRFREVEAQGGLETFVAWFEPAHRVTEATAPFFTRRFSNMAFSILTPDVCAHWDTQALSFTPGADPADAPAGDDLEAYWRTYFASTFNPARLRTAAMVREMPKRYWRNLPEASLIPEMTRAAGDRTTAMVEKAPSEPARRIVRAPRADGAALGAGDGPPSSLEAVAAGVDGCRRCPLWRDATQGVAGEGPAEARLMIVGEQPGDQEDLAGRPFVGPAGQVFDEALSAAGVPRNEAYVTNAVKHFKHQLRGKRRLHKTPEAPEIEACRWWLDAERQIVRPRVIIAMGATAARSVLGKATPIGKLRGQALQLEDQAQAVVTWHPSYLLRLPDRAAKAKAQAEFIEDLRFAWSLANAAVEA